MVKRKKPTSVPGKKKKKVYPKGIPDSNPNRQP